jgi:type I restriction enzyme R subunit
VVISTIQRVYRVLAGDTAPEGDDPGLDDYVPDTPVTVVYTWRRWQHQSTRP